MKVSNAEFNGELIKEQVAGEMETASELRR